MKRERLRERIAQGAPSLAEVIPDAALDALLKDRERTHPLQACFASGADGAPPQTIRLLDVAVRRVRAWLRSAHGKGWAGWWNSKLDDLAGPNAGGTLAELRAFGVLLGTHAAPTGGFRVGPIKEGSRKGAAPDFRIGGSPEVFVEVCCPDSAEDERRKNSARHELSTRLVERGRRVAARRLERSVSGHVQLQCDGEARVTLGKGGQKATVRERVDVRASKREDGSHAILTMHVATSSPYGLAKKEGPTHSVASILASKKSPGQIPIGSPGILWMDLTGGAWAMSVADCLPARRIWLEFALAGTPGVWHSFYGRKGVSLMYEREPIGLALGESEGLQRQCFDGRFRTAEGSRWSAAVLLCRDGVVLFEHPAPEAPLPFQVLRELVALESFDDRASFYRFAEDDFKGLQGRLQDVEAMLAFFSS